MKSCSYCGKGNEEDSLVCSGCGTSLAAPEMAESAPPADSSGLTPSTPRPYAGRATLILLIFLATQFVVALVVMVIGIVIAGAHGNNLHDQKQVARVIRTIMPTAMTMGLAASGVAMLLTSRALLREHLGDASPEGAAWIIGSPKRIAQGLGVGSMVGLCFVAVAVVLGPRWMDGTPGPLARMAVTSGLSQALWFAMALLLAPPFEELLFRGVLYGGYRRSFGPNAAAVLTTSIFCVLHITEMLHFPPSIAAVTSLALAALWFRLRSAAIGPAIAVHFGYNAVIALVVACSTMVAKGAK